MCPAKTRSVCSVFAIRTTLVVLVLLCHGSWVLFSFSIGQRFYGQVKYISVMSSRFSGELEKGLLKRFKMLRKKKKKKKLKNNNTCNSVKSYNNSNKNIKKETKNEQIQKQFNLTLATSTPSPYTTFTHYKVDAS